MLLDYEHQMIVDVYEGSGLLVSGRGMVGDRIFLQMLKLFSVENVLVLVLNCSKAESQFFIDQLSLEKVSKIPILISSDSLTKNHWRLYAEGGIVFLASTQILIVDYLSGRIPGQLVTGVLVYRAHNVLETSQEAFALRLFKENNPNGFVKGFSENSLSLSTGFSQLDRIMTNLQVRNVYLWPRFSLDVITTLNNCKPNIEESSLELSAASVTCQLSLLDIIRQLLTDLKAESPILDADELTVENAITNIFDSVIRLYIDPVWNQISKESRRLIFQIKEMRRLVYLLIEQDPVNFHILLDTMKADAINQRSCWVTLKGADSLLAASKSRLCKDSKIDLKKINSIKQLNIEVPNKWNKLLEILENIRNAPCKYNERKTLIIVNKEATAVLLANICKNGAKSTLNNIASKYLISKKSNFRAKVPVKSSSNSDKGSNSWQVLQSDCCVIVEDLDIVIYFGCEGSSEYYCQTPKARIDNMIRVLEPRNIILFDPRMSDIRVIENYQAVLLHKDVDDIVNVYVLMYGESVEEQRYLTVLRKEKESFQSLINMKANLLLPEFCYENPRCVYGTSTRVGGESVVANIIVDMREFRSALPSLLHRKGFKIEPLTINVGDYILAPHICVERKSVSDFIGSLNNGRLFNQCSAMSRLYPLPILLIEFSPTSPSISNKNTFSLFIGKNRISEEINSRDILSKLSLLTLHFPKLRILWSHSPYSTVELFTDLKIGRPEPSSEKLPQNSGSAHADENIYNDDVVDALLKIPGISWKNHGSLVRRIKSLMDLLNFTEQELSDLFENKVTGHTIYSFLHGSKLALLTKIDEEATKKKFKKPRFDLLKKL